MLSKSLEKLYVQGLGKLQTEVESYRDEKDMWKTSAEIPNSAGNLTLHLIGNLNHFFGATISESGYVRNRDAEFSSDNVSRAQLVEGIEGATEVVRTALKGLTDGDLEKIFPIEFQNEAVSTEYVLTYLLGHFNYHLGQINYHRRLLAS